MARLKEWIARLSNIAVVIGIVFLIIEINQNTDMIRALINQGRAETAMAEQQSVYNSGYIPSIIDKIKNSEILSDEDTIRYEHYFRAFNRNQDNIFRQYNEGLLGDNIPRSVKQAVQTVIASNEVGKNEWDRSKQSYSDAYIKFVDAAISDYMN